MHGHVANVLVCIAVQGKGREKRKQHSGKILAQQTHKLQVTVKPLCALFPLGKSPQCCQVLWPMPNARLIAIMFA